MVICLRPVMVFDYSFLWEGVRGRDLYKIYIMNYVTGNCNLVMCSVLRSDTIDALKPVLNYLELQDKIGKQNYAQPFACKSNQ